MFGGSACYEGKNCQFKRYRNEWSYTLKAMSWYDVICNPWICKHDTLYIITWEDHRLYLQKCHHIRLEGCKSLQACMDSLLPFSSQLLPSHSWCTRMVGSVEPAWNYRSACVASWRQWRRVYLSVVDSAAWGNHEDWSKCWYCSNLRRDLEMPCGTFTSRRSLQKGLYRPGQPRDLQQ